MMSTQTRKAALLLQLTLWLAPAQSATWEAITEPGTGDYHFALPDLEGKTRSSTDYASNVILVNFWASWCPPCIHEMPALQQLGATLAGEPFEIAAVNVGEPKFRVWKFTQLVKFRLPVLLEEDKQVFADWQVRILPTSFLIDRNGRPRHRVEGVPDWDSDQTLSLIRQLLQEE